MQHESSYTPTTGIGRWLDQRLPIPRVIHGQFVDFPTPRNLNYMWTLGGILTFFLMLQIITGIVLVMHFVPHVDLAFESVEHIRRDVNYGWLIQKLHANGASFFFVAVYIHILRGMYYGSYKAPREMIWILGVFIYILMMAAAFLGYVLPWGQMSYWAATVITNLFTAIPYIGETLLNWLQGGYSVGQPTLNRFLSLHYLVPFIIAAFVFLHIWALHVVGNNNPLGVEMRNAKKEGLPFHPYYTMKDGFAMVVFLIFFAWMVFYVPDYLGHSDNFIPADPLVTPPHIVPEWYFLPFYAILRAIPDKLWGVVFMGASIFVLFLLPWLDTSRVRSTRFRPVYKWFFWFFVFTVFALGYLGAKPPEGVYLYLGRFFTIYYFMHFFLVLPLLGFLEKPDPVPPSISKAVLGEDLDTPGAGAPPEAVAAAPEKR